MNRHDERERDIRELRESLSWLGEASLRVNEIPDFGAVLRGALDSARSLTGARYFLSSATGWPRGRRLVKQRDLWKHGVRASDAAPETIAWGIIYIT